MLVDLVISRSLSLLKTYAQSNPSGSGTISPVFLAAFLAFKYSGGTSFLVYVADSSQNISHCLVDDNRQQGVKIKIDVSLSKNSK